MANDNDKDLASDREQAGNASSVRWLALRVRIDHLLLLSSAMKPAEKDASSEPQNPLLTPQEADTKSKTVGRKRS
jgi:hypothetical protein